MSKFLLIDYQRSSLCGLMETVVQTRANPTPVDDSISGRNRRVRVALCSPANRGQQTRHASSLGIRSLAAFLPEEIADVLVVDSHCWGWGAKKTAEAIKEFNPDIIGIQLIFHKQIQGFTDLVEVASEIGLANRVWIAGGHVPTFSAKELLHKFDILSCVIRGEGELPFSVFVQSDYVHARDHNTLMSIPNMSFINGGQLIETDTVGLIPKLDSLPFPIFLEEDGRLDGPASVMGSRGCYATCEYCSVPAFSKTATGPLWRLRSATNLVDEVEALAKEYKQTHISFLDDIFLGTDNRSRSRALEVARQVRERNINIKFSIECRSDAVSHDIFAELKESGLERVFLGLESGSEAVLKRFKKMSGVDENKQALDVLQSLGISAGVGFIMFDPESSVIELKENLDFLCAYGLLSKRAVSNKMRAYPGTPIHARLLTKGRLNGDPLYPDYEFTSHEVSAFYDFVNLNLSSLDFIDLWLLKQEFQSAGIPDAYAKYVESRSAYSNDIMKICSSALSEIEEKSFKIENHISQIEELTKKWDNLIDGN